MTQVLHAIEEKIIKALKEYGTSDMTKLLTRTDLGEDQIRRGTEWLRLKKLANVNTQTSIELQTPLLLHVSSQRVDGVAKRCVIGTLASTSIAPARAFFVKSSVRPSSVRDICCLLVFLVLKKSGRSIRCT